MSIIIEKIQAELLAWDGVTVQPHRFGGIEFQYRGKELGHLHGDSVADLLFPRAVRDELVADGRAHPHHIYPDSGWVTLYIHGAEQVQGVIGLFRLQYERVNGGGSGQTVERKEP